MLLGPFFENPPNPFAWQVLWYITFILYKGTGKNQSGNIYISLVPLHAITPMVKTIVHTVTSSKKVRQYLKVLEYWTARSHELKNMSQPTKHASMENVVFHVKSSKTLRNLRDLRHFSMSAHMLLHLTQYPIIVYSLNIQTMAHF